MQITPVYAPPCAPSPTPSSDFTSFSTSLSPPRLGRALACDHRRKEGEHEAQRRRTTSASHGQSEQQDHVPPSTHSCPTLDLSQPAANTPAFHRIAFTSLAIGPCTIAAETVIPQVTGPTDQDQVSSTKHPTPTSRACLTQAPAPHLKPTKSWFMPQGRSPGFCRALAPEG